MENNKTKNFNEELFKKQLENHLGVLIKELKDNNGIPPKHRIEEEKRRGLL